MGGGRTLSTTGDFVDFVSSRKYSDLPSDVTRMAKTLVLDLFGSIIYSSKMEWSQKVVNLVRGFGSKGKSTVIPSGLKTSPPAAALANGTMGHGFELDDVHDGGMHHPGAVVIPAALAAGEEQSVDGPQFLLAVVMGYEAMCRIGMAVGAKNHNLRGFHATGTCGPFGAAVAAGKILGLTKQSLLDALGIAGSFSSGVLEFSQESSDAGGMIKRLHAGRGSEGGLTAALLARDGFRGPSDIIGGRYGFCRVYSDQPKIDLMNRGLGSDYEILNVGIKPYACCALVHPIIDGITFLQEKYKLKEEEVEGIQIGCAQNLVDHNAIYEIDSIMAAQYSAPYGAALAFTGGARDPNNFNKEASTKKGVQEILRKTKLFKDDEIDKAFPALQGVKVRVRLKDGRKIDHEVVHAKGRPKNPMSFEEVCDKFQALTQDRMDSKTRGQVIERIKTLDVIPNISELTNLLVIH
jgi:2-methylcitrate dehydratase PrpD